jgi:hypothetical protein
LLIGAQAHDVAACEHMCDVLVLDSVADVHRSQLDRAQAERDYTEWTRTEVRRDVYSPRRESHYTRSEAGAPHERCHGACSATAQVNAATAGPNFVATETQRREDGEEHDRNGNTLQLETDAHGDLRGLQLGGDIMRVL